MEKTSRDLFFFSLVSVQKGQEKNVFLGGQVGKQVEKFSVFLVTIVRRLKKVILK